MSDRLPVEPAVTRPDAAIRRSEQWRRFWRGHSLEHFSNGLRDNIINLRLLAALMVVLGHSSLGGRGSWKYDPLNMLLPQAYIHRVGLMMFFMISGYLITLSFQRRPHIVRFFRARALRIFPGLAACLVLTAFVVGPLFTTLPLREYFSLHRPDSPYAYLIGITLFKVANQLPGVFQGSATGNPGQVNSPIWTLSVEAMMYACVAGAGVLRLLNRPWTTSCAIAALFASVLLWPMTQGIAPPYVLTIEGFFGAGAIACLLRRYIPLSSGIMLGVAIACYLAKNSLHAVPFMWLAIAYFVLWFSYVPNFPAIPDGIDLSYGTYIWAWPTQQALVQITGIVEPLLLFAMTVPVVLTIALASWSWIEKPALRFKNRPGNQVLADRRTT